MTADPPTRRRRDGAIAVVTVLVSLNACAAFGIQAWFAYGFARHVWTLPFRLAVAVPVALDLFVATLMVITYLLRDASRGSVRYVWGALIFGIALQVAASESFAAWSHYGTPGRVASFGPAVVLAVALHTLILVVQHRRRPDSPPPVRVTPAPRPPKKKNKTDTPVAPPRLPTTANGMDTRALAESRGVSLRRAQQLVKAARDGSVTSRSATNGHAGAAANGHAVAAGSDAPVAKGR